MLYPLKFYPILKKSIWGGERLVAKGGDKITDPIGESWEISAVEDHISIVSNGILADNNLQELIEIYMGEIVGDHIYEKFGIEFPLLIKYIDAHDNLSIQVHPDDKIAKERHNAYGKTEMWYVESATPNASLIAGFNRHTDKSEYLQMLHRGQLLDLMNVEPVKKGDCFFIPAGLVHAIQKGCFIAEIQQTSDITYRIYDYDRRDQNGELRELHTDLATDVIDYSYHPTHKVNYKIAENQAVKLVESPWFTTSILEFSKKLERDYIMLDSFVIYMCIEGGFTVAIDGCEPVTVTKGETVLIPATLKNLTLNPDGITKLLEIYID